MAKWAVVHLIHVNTPHRHIPKLVVEGVPRTYSSRDVKAWLEEAGYGFGEFGIPWANHYIERLKDCPPEVRGAYRQGEVETITFEELEEVDPD